MIRNLSAEENFSYEMNLPNYFIVGQYNIFASVTVDGIPKVVSKSIYLLDEDTELGPIYKSSINVESKSHDEQIESSEEKMMGLLIPLAAGL